MSSLAHARYCTVLVTDEAVAEIVRVGKERAPREACGVMTAEGQVLELENVSSEPESSYEVRGLQIAAALRSWLDEVPAEVEDPAFLVWHTHPSGHVGPSAGDMAMRIAGLRYLVVTLDGEACRY